MIVEGICYWTVYNISMSRRHTFLHIFMKIDTWSVKARLENLKMYSVLMYKVTSNISSV